MRTVTAREAQQAFDDLLTEVEQGEDVLIIRDGQPVAVVAPYRERVMSTDGGTAALTTAERDAAIEYALALTRAGLVISGRRLTRDEMHER